MHHLSLDGAGTVVPGVEFEETRRRVRAIWHEAMEGDA
jgi:hypothetical protein